VCWNKSTQYIEKIIASIPEPFCFLQKALNSRLYLKYFVRQSNWTNITIWNSENWRKLPLKLFKSSCGKTEILLSIKNWLTNHGYSSLPNCPTLFKNQQPVHSCDWSSSTPHNGQRPAEVKRSGWTIDEQWKNSVINMTVYPP